jgi:3-oxoacyl-[acyl-carrier protein] reductase
VIREHLAALLGAVVGIGFFLGGFGETSTHTTTISRAQATAHTTTISRAQANAFDNCIAQATSPQASPHAFQHCFSLPGGASGVVVTECGSAGRAAVDEALGGRRLGALVNNAGITRDALLSKLSEDDFRAVIAVNLGSAYELTSSLLDADAFADGAPVVGMSARAYLGNLGQFNYAMSKGGLVGMTRALAQELAPRVRVNAVAPGLTASEMTLAMPDEVRAKLISGIPLGRMAEPAEVAAAVAHLIGPDAAYVTGQVVLVCGGRSIAAERGRAPRSPLGEKESGRR